MKEYPSILAEIVKKPIYAFDKLDGSNVRSEWSFKRGFYKFGTRERLVGEDERILGKAPILIREKYATRLDAIFRKERWQRVTCFFEFYGPNSFAGWHSDKDAHTVTLFDLLVEKRGFLEPREYLKLLKGVETAKLLYRGNPNAEFIASVKDGSLPGMSFEGVVCKGKIGANGLPLMFKVKSNAWYQALRERCAGDVNLFEARA